MIITVTPNPAVDQTVFVDALHVGDVNRFREWHLDPAGKGINVSRVAHRLGWPTMAFGFLAGEVGQIIERALTDERVQFHFVPVPGQTRINVTVVDRGRGTATSFYGPGPAVDGETLATLTDLLHFWLQTGRVLVLAGSLPEGVSTDYYASLIRSAQGEGTICILDANGEALRLGVEAKPYLIKPNVTEAEHLLGRRLPDLAAVIEGAREVVSRGVSVVVVSMGKDGAVCVDREHVWHARPPQVPLRSTVGSGDSLVAGLAVALARGESLDKGLRIGTAAGAATAMTPGTALGTAADIAELLPQVEIKQLE